MLFFSSSMIRNRIDWQIWYEGDYQANDGNFQAGNRFLATRMRKIAYLFTIWCAILRQMTAQSAFEVVLVALAFSLPLFLSVLVMGKKNKNKRLYAHEV